MVMCTNRAITAPGLHQGLASNATSYVDLEVGRVDLANMPAFAKGETELLRQHLNKDHNFRHKIITAEPRGLIDNNFGVFGGEVFCSLPNCQKSLKLS